MNMRQNKKVFLNLFNDGEEIKDHMIQFMQENGSVTRTLFGIELGTICKTPNRGRTKLVIESYSDVFEVQGEIVYLKNCELPGSSSSGDGVRGNQLQDNSTAAVVKKRSSSPAMRGPHIPTITNSFVPPYSIPQLHPLSSSQQHFPASQMPCWSGISQFYAWQRPSANAPKIFQQPSVLDVLGQATQQHVQENQHYKNSVDCETQMKYSEDVVFGLLNENGGSMEWTSLLACLQIPPNDVTGKDDLYQQVCNSSRISMNDSIVHASQVAPSEILLSQEPRAQKEARQPPCIPAQDIIKEEVKQATPNLLEMLQGQYQLLFDTVDLENVTVVVGNINVENVSIDKLNLHLHASDTCLFSSQVPDIDMLKSIIGATHSSS
eukprot:TRINITY_DN30_c1_g1_i1.p1 TRINITY_DN30_c1_g1~~TRINITY_DN30_c1_g1_i1.p1  ORF type:complete len:378 (-),score=37.47 TRINITY_DN30_c1_g1_i1:1697-2830(-)